MNTEQKAKAYDEALKTAAQWIKDGCSDKEKICLESIFPELRESEDERIREWLIDYFKEVGNSWIHRDISPEQILAYLEKHKEPEDVSASTMIPSCWIEKQKEQKHPNGCFTCDEYKKGYEEGRRNGFTAGYNKAMKEVEQKEQKPVVTHGETYHVDTLGTQQMIAGKMPQKPVQLEEEKEYVRTLKGLVSDFIRDSGGGITDVEYYQNICDWLNGRHIEQEPAEYLSKDKVYAIMTKLTELSTSELIPLNSDEYKKINEITSDVRSLLNYPIEQKPNIELIQKSWYMEGYHDKEFNCEPKWIIKTGEGGPRYEENPKYGQIIEQKPAEWSEEDKKLIDDVINSLCCYQNTLSDYQKEIVGEEIQKLKSLKPQPKQEWSEKDEKMRDRLIDRLQFITLNTRTDTTSPNITFFDEIAWLKSLRPQSKQKQNDYITPHKEFFKFIYDRLINVHKENPNVDYMRSFKERLNNLSFGEKQEWSEEDIDKMVYERARKSGTTKTEMHFYRQGIEDTLKSLRPSWKPSENQMSMLLAVVNDPNNAGSESCHLSLKSLYNDLKKL